MEIQCSVREYAVILQAKIITTMVEFGFLDRLDEPSVRKSIKDEIILLVKKVHELEGEEDA